MADADELLEPLEWDSRHFGQRVERTRAGDLDEAALGEALERARKRGTRLVYHFRPPSMPLSRGLLDRFGGLRVCTQVRLSKELLPDSGTPPSAGIRISHASGDAASDALRGLALVAGHFSRFRLDPGIPEERFERLYFQWIDRSVRGEIADRVLVAVDESGTEIALVTVVFRPPERGEFGLVAVAPRARRTGTASSLLAAAEVAMARAGLPRSEVATQRENEAACRLYASLGYHPIREEDAYHFHLGDEPLSPAQEQDRP